MEELEELVQQLWMYQYIYLVEPGLPKSLWGETARTAVFRKTHIPHSTLGNDTQQHLVRAKMPIYIFCELKDNLSLFTKRDIMKTLTRDLGNVL